ncbi:MAG: hypothetical protein IJL43_02480 [Lachnospiraceae bacterium]|nr:hypothetical protein [Lachnospiraceae bacterium]
MKKHFFGFIFAVIAAAAVLLLSGCSEADGALIYSTVTIDENFKGSRVITASIPLKYTAGYDELLRVAKEALPNHLSLRESDATTEERAVFDFILTFDSLEEYVLKSTVPLFAGDPHREYPSVVFEKNDTMFRKGFTYTENFSSRDLLEWYHIALNEAGLLGTDAFITSKEITVNLGGEIYECTGSVSIDTAESHLLSGVSGKTVLLEDGSFVRTITFSADYDTVQYFKKAGTPLNTWFEGFEDEATVYDTEKVNGQTHYLLKISGDAKTVEAETKRILNSDENRFSWTVEPGFEEFGIGTKSLDFTECWDAAYYLDAAADVSAGLYLQEARESGPYEKKLYETVYVRGEPVLYSVPWHLNFESGELTLDCKDPAASTVTYRLNIRPGQSEDLIHRVQEDYREITPAGVSADHQDEAMTFVFHGNREQVQEDVNRFLYGSYHLDYDPNAASSAYFTPGGFSLSEEAFSTGTWLRQANVLQAMVWIGATADLPALKLTSADSDPLFDPSSVDPRLQGQYAFLSQSYSVYGLVARCAGLVLALTGLILFILWLVRLKAKKTGLLIGGIASLLLGAALLCLTLMPQYPAGTRYIKRYIDAIDQADYQTMHGGTDQTGQDAVEIIPDGDQAPDTGSYETSLAALKGSALSAAKSVPNDASDVKVALIAFSEKEEEAYTETVGGTVLNTIPVRAIVKVSYKDAKGRAQEIYRLETLRVVTFNGAFYVY